MAISINDPKGDIAKQLLETIQSKEGVRILSDPDKTKNEILNKNIKNIYNKFPEPDNGIMSKLLGGDAYHPLYNHNKSEICNMLQNYPNDIEKIENIIKNLPVVKLNIKCRWLAIIIVLIIIIIFILYVKDYTSLSKSVNLTIIIGICSSLIIFGILFKVIGTSWYQKKGENEWKEFINEYNALENLIPSERCKYFRDQDNIDRSHELQEKQIASQNKGFQTGFLPGLGIGTGIELTKKLFN
jgi:hypothetical protein